MKRKNILYIILLSLGALNHISCEKSLNALPSQSVLDGTLVVDQNSAKIALNGAYYRMAHGGASLSIESTRWHMYNEIMPAVLSGWMYSGFSPNGTQELNRLLPSGTSGEWSYAYYILNAANATIQGVEALDDSKFSGNTKQEILAEARFLRAYAHFYLLSYFGEWYDIESPYGVLLRKKSLKFGGGEAVPRSSVRESYGYILQDLDFAIANAKDVHAIHYANKTAAKALKAKVLMNRGGQSDYQDVISIADDIIANPNYELEPNLQNLFQSKGLASKEVILGVTPFANQIAKKATYQFVQSSVYVSSASLVTLLQNDPRAAWMLENANYSSLPGDAKYLSKYKGSNYEDAYILRLTELYLLKAEAIVRSDGSLISAKNILKEVMGKAGVTDFTAIDAISTSEDFLVELYYEYTRNMVSENGAEWFALLRLPFETVKSLRPTIQEKEQYILPIPSTEFEGNPVIGDQNPGYTK